MSEKSHSVSEWVFCFFSWCLLCSGVPFSVVLSQTRWTSCWMSSWYSLTRSRVTVVMFCFPRLGSLNRLMHGKMCYLMYAIILKKHILCRTSLSCQMSKRSLSSCIMWKLQYGWLRKHLYATISFDVLLKKKSVTTYRMEFNHSTLWKYTRHLRM